MSAIVLLCFGGGSILYNAFLVGVGIVIGVIPAETTLFTVGLALVSVGLGCKATEIGKKSDRRAKLFLDKMDELETNILTKIKMLEANLAEVKSK